jgi:hypothetical protein
MNLLLPNNAQSLPCLVGILTEAAQKEVKSGMQHRYLDKRVQTSLWFQSAFEFFFWLGKSCTFKLKCFSAVLVGKRWTE